jgi:hypothetical protein
MRINPAEYGAQACCCDCALSSSPALSCLAKSCGMISTRIGSGGCDAHCEPDHRSILCRRTGRTRRGRKSTVWSCLSRRPHREFRTCAGHVCKRAQGTKSSRTALPITCETQRQTADLQCGTLYNLQRDLLRWCSVVFLAMLYRRHLPPGVLPRLQQRACRL